jgi:CRP-like cAMP-binding protein
MPFSSSPRAPSRCGCRRAGCGLGTGDFFAEMALLTGRRRQADVVALTYCRLLALRKGDFERFVATNPEAAAIIDRVARRAPL